MLKNPISIVFTVCSFLKHWAGLYTAEDKESICAGAEQLIKKAKEMVAARSSSVVQKDVPRLTYK